MWIISGSGNKYAPDFFFYRFFFFFNLSFKWFPIELHSILLAWRLLGCPPYNCSCTRLGTHQKRHPSLLVAGINTAEVPSHLRSNVGREFRIQGDARAPPPRDVPSRCRGRGLGSITLDTFGGCTNLKHDRV